MALVMIVKQLSKSAGVTIFSLVHFSLYTVILAFRSLYLFKSGFIIYDCLCIAELYHHSQTYFKNLSIWCDNNLFVNKLVNTFDSKTFINKTYGLF